ncbi:hypothetical protein G7046_g4676 [Stylonectria norvegica]|nr:hypothetical protein G7046_g4676 [Stylonectria norvegica]
MDVAPDLWAIARSRLESKDDEKLRKLEAEKSQTAAPSTLSNDIDGMIALTKLKKDECEGKFWKFKLGRHELILRDCATKIITWLQSFKEIGDVATQFDPVHAALPWAAFRFILQSTIVEREQMGAILVIVETTCRLVLRCRVYESIYCAKTIDTQETLGSKCLAQFREEVVTLYTAILRTLATCYSALSKTTLGRTIGGILRPGSIQELVNELSGLERRVGYEVQACEGLVHRAASDRLSQLLRNFDSPLFRVEEKVSKLLAMISEDEHWDMAAWMSTVLFGKHHQEVSRLRTQHTCEWLLQHERFKEWHETSSCAIMLIYGLPGAGKTFLVSRVVDWVRNGLQDNENTDEGFAYFYCNRHEEDRRRPESILRSLVRQLSSRAAADNEIHQTLRDLKKRLMRDGRSLDIDASKDVLLELVNTYPATTIVLDALDECEADSREELMTALDYLMERSHSPLKVLISSRPNPDISNHFRAQPCIEVQATDNETDIKAFVDDRLSRDTRWASLSRNLQEEIRSTLLAGSRGMFQWAALQVQQLVRLKFWSTTNIKERLGKLPQGLEAAYDEIWDSIERQSPHEKRLAERAFKWLLCTFEPPTPQLLVVAILIDPDSDDPDNLGEIPDEETMNGICGNLLTLDKALNVWRFCHLSAREYWQVKHHSTDESHYYVATACLKFLNTAPRCITKRCSCEPNLSITHICAHLSSYAMGWGLHHVSTQEGVWPSERKRLIDLLKAFLGSVQVSSNCYKHWSWAASEATKRHYDKNYWAYWRGLEIFRTSYQPDSFNIHDTLQSPVYTMCAFGFRELLSDWWEDEGIDIDACDKHGCSLFARAVWWGQNDICRYLLRRGIKLDNGTPLPLVATMQCGSKVLFDAVIEAGADVNAVDARGTPLLVVAIYFHSKGILKIEFVRALIDAGAEVDVICQSRNALYFAAISNPHGSCFKLLLERGANIDMKTGRGTALDIACRESQWEIAQQLILADALGDSNRLLRDLVSGRGPVISFTTPSVKAPTCVWGGARSVLEAGWKELLISL